MADHGPDSQQQLGRCSRTSLATTVVVLIVLAVLASVIPSVIIRSLGFQSHVKNVVLAPGGTSVVNYSTIFCSELTLTVDNLKYTASLYLLDKPLIVRGSTLNIQMARLYIDKGTYKHWNFGLLPKSVISISVCAVFARCKLRATQAPHIKSLQADSEVVVLHYVEGDKAYNKKSFLEDKNYTVPISPNQDCGSHDIYTRSFNWKILEANTYYLVFQNNANNSQYDDVSVHINMTIDRTKYECTPNSRSDRNDDCGCMVREASNCRVATDLKEHYTAAVTIHDDDNVTYSVWDRQNYFHLRVFCDPRWWFYTVIAVSGLFLFLTPAFIVLATCYCYKKCKEAKYVVIPVQEHPPAPGGHGPPATINPVSSSASPYSNQPSPHEHMWQYRPHTAESSRNTGSNTPYSPSSHLIQHHVHASPKPVQSGQPMIVNGGNYGSIGSTGKSLETMAAFSSQWQSIDGERVTLLQEKNGREEQEEVEEKEEEGREEEEEKEEGKEEEISVVFF